MADFESRLNQRESEWKLDSQSLSYALSKINFRPDIKLFSKFVSFRPDPSAYAIHAFSLQWSQLKFYPFPPFSVIPGVLSKIQNEGALGICVIPDWPAQGWYPKPLQMLKQEPVHLKARRDLLRLPSNPQKHTHFGTN